MQEQERFKVDDQVKVSNLQSPFFSWTGVVKEVFHNDNGWVRYRVQCAYPDDVIQLHPVFDDAELSEMGTDLSA